MTKLEKCKEDLERARKKKEEWGRRVQELERKYREEEKTAVHEMMSAANLTPEQLAKIIEQAKHGNLSCADEIKTEE